MSNMILTDLILWTLVLSSPLGDPSLRGGNGIPPRCVYLEEMAADLDGQDWLDMDNIEQVRCQCVFKASLCSSNVFLLNKPQNVWCIW